MNDLNNLCFLCLTYNKYKISKEDNCFNLREELQHFIPEHILQKSSIPKHVCDECLKNINNINKFRRKCLNNIALYTRYVQNLSQESGSYKYLSLIDFLHQNSNIIEQVQIKVEDTIGENYLKNEMIEDVRIKEDLCSSDNEMSESSNDNQTEELFKNTSDIEQIQINVELDNYEPDINPVPQKTSYNTNNIEQIQVNVDVENFKQENLSEMNHAEASCNKNNFLEHIPQYSAANINATHQILSQSGENLLPERSSDLYMRQYDAFVAWCASQDVKTCSEDVLISYFSEKAKKYKSSTLWSTYSMLKSTMLVRENIDISKYTQLLEFIKQKNTGYKPKKSNIFTREDINRFLTEAPDQNYLMWKVCLIFGIAGGTRMDELKKMTIDDIEDRGEILLISVPDSKTGRHRIFTVTNQMCDDLNPIELYRKYISLRPFHTPHKLLFIFYRQGKCSTQPIGIHTFGKIPSLIATYLKLPDTNSYTGHAFRRTSACLLAETGSDVVTLKQHGGWKTINVAKGYIDLAKKQEIATRILRGHSSSSTN